MPLQIRAFLSKPSLPRLSAPRLGPAPSVPPPRTVDLTHPAPAVAGALASARPVRRLDFLSILGVGEFPDFAGGSEAGPAGIAGRTPSLRIAPAGRNLKASPPGRRSVAPRPGPGLAQGVGPTSLPRPRSSAPPPGPGQSIFQFPFYRLAYCGHWCASLLLFPRALTERRKGI